MAREEIDLVTTDDQVLAGALVDAAQRAREEHRMTFLIGGGGQTVAAIVPVGVAVAMDPGVVRMAGDTHWTELPAGGMTCPAGEKIIQVTFSGSGIPPEAVHDDSTPCTHTRSPAGQPGA